MNTVCPNKECDGELEVASEEVDNGDGVWFESGLAFWLPEGDDDKVTCSEGCVLTPDQVASVEKQFADDYYNS